MQPQGRWKEAALCFFSRAVVGDLYNRSLQS
jgi:hypothetical protein